MEAAGGDPRRGSAGVIGVGDRGRRSEEEIKGIGRGGRQTRLAEEIGGGSGGGHPRERSEEEIVVTPT